MKWLMKNFIIEFLIFFPIALALNIYAIAMWMKNGNTLGVFINTFATAFTIGMIVCYLVMKEKK